jgi:hypothetical protein
MGDRCTSKIIERRMLSDLKDQVNSEIDDAAGAAK